jgi:ribulose-bisphosphate carboxylase large chain
MPDRLTATYRIETRYPLADAAAALAGEQSSGTFRAVPGETPALLERYGARVESVTDEGEVEAPSLPGSRGPRNTPAHPRRGVIKVSWNTENFGPSLPAVWATVAGNLFELHHFSGLKLLDIEFPPSFAERYPGPAFGVTGTRDLTGVDGRPVIGTIVKPSVGLTPDDTAGLVDTLIGAGLDFVKDDELQADGPHSPFGHRFEAVMRVIDRHADRTGRKAMYAANITGEFDDMLRRLDLVAERGGTCAMVVLAAVGLPAVSALRKRSRVAIHGHRAGWGIYDRHPALGLSYVAYQKFWRLAGVDHLHVNGLRNKFCEADDSVIASAKACLTPVFPHRPQADVAMPVFSSAQSAVQASDTYARLGSNDLIFCCGGGIVSHPQGIAAGVASVREAWEAAQAGIPAHEFAKDHPAFAAALESFGS